MGVLQAVYISINNNLVLYNPTFTDNIYSGISRATVGTILVIKTANIILLEFFILSFDSAYAACDATKVDNSTLKNCNNNAVHKICREIRLKQYLIITAKIHNRR